MRAPELPSITPAAARHIVQHLRAQDRREIEATNWDMNPVRMVDKIMALESFTFYAKVNDTPAALIGGFPMWPGVWQVYAYGTDDFDRVAPTLTKFALRFMVPAITNSGGHRAQCDSIEGHDKAHRWLEMMGYENEGPMRKFGRHGETFYRFARVTGDDDVQQP